MKTLDCHLEFWHKKVHRNITENILDKSLWVVLFGFGNDRLLFEI